MTEIRLQNPYVDDVIKVRESYGQIAKILDWIEQGNINYLRLIQIEPEERLITINPKHFAKIEFKPEEVEG
jgi:hypothetical protein|nr:MAG TPA: hypothetical protein [Caudoviricetes sp.]